MTTNKTSWLKFALLAVVCQVAFLTGTMTTHAEETEPSVTASQVFSTSEEAKVTAPEEVTSPEVSADVTPATEAPAPTEKAVLDETIGESQRPRDSPVETSMSAVTTLETTPRAPSEPAEVPTALEKSVSNSDIDTEETKKETDEATIGVAPSNASILEESTQSVVEENKSAVSEETKTEADKVVNESKESEKRTEEQLTLFVAESTTRSVRMKRAVNTGQVHSQLVTPSNGLNWGSAILPNGRSFTYDRIEIFDVDGHVAFCVEPGVPGGSGTFNKSALETYIKDAAIRKKIALISYFGYVGSIDKSLERRIATQFYIHEVLNSNFYGTNPVLNYEAFKQEIDQKINNATKKASFNNQTKTVKVGQTIEVSDTNNVLKDVVKINTPRGITAKIQGNQLVITATKEAPEKATISLDRLTVYGAPMVYKKAGVQTIGILNYPDPLSSVLKLNVLKEGNIRVFKEDAETGVKAQGAASLENAVYGLYQADGKKIKEITLKNINGKVQAEIKDLDPGKYVLKEIKAPKGYVLSDETIEIVVEPGKTVNMTVKDQVIKGTINLVKVANKDLVDSTNPDNKPKLAGIEISLTSKTTGQVVKTVVTDKDGYATFGKNAVVFDTYILSETKGKEGYKLFEPFEVTISENGQTFHYVLEDKIIEQKLKVVKVDEETGKVIAIPGTQFKIWDRLANNGQGGYVSMALPNDTELSDVFTTNEKGYFVTTDTLKYGKDRYELREIKAPEKYVLNTVPYVFSVTNDTDTIQLINFANRLAKANVEVFKYDTTTNFDKKTAIASVEFDLFKKDEIGTTFVGTFKTDTDGKIKVNDLLVGNYFFKEVKPLAGYLTLDKDVPFTVTVDKDGTVIALEVENKRIPPEIGTTAMGKYTNQPKVNPLTKVTITDTVKYSNLIVGKTYTVNGVLMDKEASIKAGKDVPLLVNGKEVTASKVFIAENPDGTISLDFIFDASALAGKETVVFENVYRDGRLVASHTDIHDEGQTVRIVNPKIHTKATGQNGEKQLQALPNQKVVEWVQLNDLIVGQMYKLLVQGYITPDGVKLDDTSAEKIFKADKETMEFLFHFLVDGRKLAGKGLSFAEWLEAQSEPKDENDREEHFEQVAQHNVNLKSKEQTVYFEEIPKAPQPKIPEKPQPVQSVKEVKQEVVVPMLPKTGEQTSSILMVLGLAVLVIVLGVTFYKVRKTKE
ncbi:SpaA isopeptide-forming pilin-related protein [Enterococcus avium]|uniref:SpaA isopeptide-forming pilin-related protein n=1 Tax=Enterococcus avium TaxID=33945 RepID=UPI0022E1FB76|nr:SpaA isopeptide-forming pilin-related protein [Enterococcus avium]EGS1366864.1 VaFE repeat-containing surface-anchored protein [Enterococcus faecalis]HDV0798247.1 VaFE repeat-containing surface-anchored protein [Enterococcus faecalis]HDV0880291.1 VaFE repeat-containing surface-anchored protein [Enterococcus faecalis]